MWLIHVVSKIQPNSFELMFALKYETYNNIAFMD